MRPMRLPAASLNHNAPSRTAIDSGFDPGVMPSANSVMRPSGVIAADAARLALGEPDIAVRTEDHAVGPGVRRRQREFGDFAARRDAADLVGGFFARTTDCRRRRAVMPIGVAVLAGRSNSVNVPRSGSKRPILRGAALAEPKIAVRSLHRDIGLAVGARNPVLADGYARACHRAARIAMRRPTPAEPAACRARLSSAQAAP